MPEIVNEFTGRKRIIFIENLQYQPLLVNLDRMIDFFTAPVILFFQFVSMGNEVQEVHPTHDPINHVLCNILGVINFCVDGGPGRRLEY